MQKQRPKGISILAILIIISGAISLFGIVAGPLVLRATFTGYLPTVTLDITSGVAVGIRKVYTK
jgi:hypothetical protein